MDLLSICVVAYNESSYLPRLLNDIVNQTYPHSQIELVLVDSASDDSTKQIMLDFKNGKHDFYRVLVLDNPKRIQAEGWNVAIQNASGSVISRIDSHSKLDSNFALFVMEDIHLGENVVGGIRSCLTDKNTSWGHTLLSLENSLFGSSINIARRSNKPQYVKTMFHASYRIEVFREVGLFDTHLLRTEDNEMHYRIRKAGFQLLYDPRIVSYQYTRNSYRKMIKQKYSNGLWVGLTTAVCPKCLSWYHYVPLMFLVLIIAFTLSAIFLTSVPLLVLSLVYLLFCVINTVVVSINDGFHYSNIVLPILYFGLHFFYGLGTLFGLLNSFAFKKTYYFGA